MIKSLNRAVAAACVSAVALGFASSVSAEEGKHGSKVGLLTCENVRGSGLNLLVHSTTDVKCVFKDVNGRTERYKGEAGIGLGVDLKWERKEKIVFTVLAPTFKAGTHQLAGRYAGAKATVTPGVGGGAQVLVGGSDKSISLQPALEKTRGFGIAAGLGYMYLEPDA